MSEPKEVRRWQVKIPYPYNPLFSTAVEVVEATALTEAERTIAELKCEVERLIGATQASMKVAELYEKQVTTLREQVEVCKTALDEIVDACQCETDDRDICFGIAVKALASLKGGPDGKV